MDCRVKTREFDHTKCMANQQYITLPMHHWLRICKEYGLPRSDSFIIAVTYRSQVFFGRPLPHSSIHASDIVVDACCPSRSLSSDSAFKLSVVNHQKTVPILDSCQLEPVDSNVVALSRSWQGVLIVPNALILNHRVVNCAALSTATCETVIKLESVNKSSIQRPFWTKGVAYIQLHQVLSSAIEFFSAHQSIDLCRQLLFRGILLAGPPGVGKTAVVVAICHQLNIPMHVVNGPELLSPLFGQSERNISLAFEKAAKLAASSVSVLFIDEIDALTAKRSGQDSAQTRTLAHLLTLLDGTNSNSVISTTTSGHVIVIGATNRPNAIDPAMRRPGRLDREVHIVVPSEDERRELVSVMLKLNDEQLLHVSDALDLLARVTVGYTPADLVDLVRNISTTDTSTLVSSLAAAARNAPPASLLKEYVFLKDQDSAPCIGWDDIGGMHQVRDQVKQLIEWPMTHAHVMKRLGVRASKGVLLHGPPGCSKTTIARIVAQTTGCAFYALQGGAASIYSSYVGESEAAIRRLFAAARRTLPAIIFIDEIDALVGSRDASDDAVSQRVLLTLLAEMDGVDSDASQGRLMVLAATNRIRVMDAALLRPGRFDSIIHVPLPDASDRRGILQTLMSPKRMAVDPSILKDQQSMDRLVQLTDGLSGAAIKGMLTEAAFIAMRRQADCICLCDVEASIRQSF